MSKIVDFERERLRYCENMYSLEKERKQVIERQAQFYFGIVTLFIGLLALRKDVLEAMRVAFSQLTSPAYVVVLYSVLVIFLGSLVSSILSVLMVFRPERRQKPYPRNLVTSLFSGDELGDAQDSEAAAAESALEREFLRGTAIRFALAVEKNGAYNTGKSRWLIVAGTSTLVLVFSYASLAVLVLLAVL